MYLSCCLRFVVVCVTIRITLLLECLWNYDSFAGKYIRDDGLASIPSPQNFIVAVSKLQVLYLVLSEQITYERKINESRIFTERANKDTPKKTYVDINGQLDITQYRSPSPPVETAAAATHTQTETSTTGFTTTTTAASID